VLKLVADNGTKNSFNGLLPLFILSGDDDWLLGRESWRRENHDHCSGELPGGEHLSYMDSCKRGGSCDLSQHTLPAIIAEGSKNIMKNM